MNARVMHEAVAGRLPPETSIPSVLAKKRMPKSYAYREVEGQVHGSGKTTSLGSPRCTLRISNLSVSKGVCVHVPRPGGVPVM